MAKSAKSRAAKKPASRASKKTASRAKRPALKAPAPPPNIWPYVGQIAVFAFPYNPPGWVPCQGQLMPIAPNQGLFSLLGTTYGGDGRTTFALPKLAPIGPGGPHYFIATTGTFPSHG